jgi:2-C-methyl-D-erythritol 4-phosphate cytidylyltransferase
MIGAIVVAAGSSSRMGGVDKQFAPLAGRPVLAWTVAAFERAPEVDAIAVVVNLATAGAHAWFTTMTIRTTEGAASNAATV